MHLAVELARLVPLPEQVPVKVQELLLLSLAEILVQLLVQAAQEICSLFYRHNMHQELFCHLLLILQVL